MAITKIWKVTKKLDKVISYVENKEKTMNRESDDLNKLVYYAINPKKTEEQLFVSEINCTKGIAIKEMNETRKKNKRGNIIAFHAVQSFRKGELTPELAHEIGVKLANEMWGDRFEVIVTTHLNTECLHNHFVINAVSFKDGMKYYDTKETYAIFRATSDALCEEYNLSTIKHNKNKNGKINYNNFVKKHQHGYYYTSTKEDIDLAIGQAYSYKDFENILKKLDYDITYRAEKLSVCRKGFKRNIRVERAYGKMYSNENIVKQIMAREETRIPFIEELSKVRKYKSKKKYDVKKMKSEKTSFQKMYLAYLYKLRGYKKKMKYRPISKEGREEIKKMERITKQNEFLSCRKITAFQELFLYKETLNSELVELEKELRHITYILKKDDTPKEEITKLMSDRKRIKERIKFIKREKEECKEIEEDLYGIQEFLEHEEEGKERDIDEYIRRCR